eukprot:Pompholyxophrys_punicea_v1_NODE_24_length_5258_cov_21.593175.p3 type:complete len:308 gc:universal NODE_24_length_5258_cov_21.593175:829-1752(+)
MFTDKSFIYTQALCLIRFLTDLNERENSILSLAEIAVQEESENKTSECLQGMSELRLTTSYPEIAAKVGQIFCVSDRIVLKWQREFANLGGFEEDKRGKFVRNWILNEEDLLRKFEKWLQITKHITILKATKFVNEDLLVKDGLVALLGKYKLSLPIAQSTIHSWMLRAGAVYLPVTKSYYTDRHDQADVVEYRRTYITLLDKLSLRMPLWIKLPAAAVTVEAIDNLTVRQLPNGTLEVHVDHLGVQNNEDLFVSVRAKLGVHGGHYSALFDEAAAAPCVFRHVPGVVSVVSPCIMLAKTSLFTKLT